MKCGGNQNCISNMSFSSKSCESIILCQMTAYIIVTLFIAASQKEEDKEGDKNTRKFAGRTKHHHIT